MYGFPFRPASMADSVHLLCMLNATIAALCAGIAGSNGAQAVEYREACEKAFQGASIQYGVDKEAKKLEKNAEKLARRHVPDEAAMFITGMYTVMVAQEVRISTKAVPLVQSTAVIMKINSVMLVLSWSL